MTSRWERIGLSEGGRQGYLKAAADRKWLGRYVDVLGESSSENPALPSDFGRRDDLRVYMMALNATHLECQERSPSTAADARKMCDVAVDYFCGAWREKASCSQGVFSRQQCREELYWFTEFRMALVVATLLRDRKALHQIAGYAGTDLHFDEGAWDYFQEDNTAYIALANWIVDGDLSRAGELLSQVQGSRRKRAKDFATGVEALANKSADDVRSSVVSLVRMFKKKLSVPEGLMIASWEASILWNLASMHGLVMEELEPWDADFLMTKAGVLGD